MSMSIHDSSFIIRSFLITRDSSRIIAFPSPFFASHISYVLCRMSHVVLRDLDISSLNESLIIIASPSPPLPCPPVHHSRIALIHRHATRVSHDARSCCNDCEQHVKLHVINDEQMVAMAVAVAVIITRLMARQLQPHHRPYPPYNQVIQC